MTPIDQLKRFNHLYCEIESLYHDAAQKLGLYDSALQILYAVRTEEAPLSMSGIMRLTGISKQTLHSSIRNLEQRGILRVERGSGKSRTLHLTEAGEQYVAQRIDPLLAAEADIYKDWSEEEVDQLFLIASKYRSALKARIETLTPAALPDPTLQEDP